MSIIDPGITRKISILILAFCIFIALNNQNTLDHNKAASSHSSTLTTETMPMLTKPMYWSIKNRILEAGIATPQPLQYDFYRDSCPLAENIVRAVIQELSRVRSDVAPALLRLVFHDCFIEGCDASILLDSWDGIKSEKEAPPNESMKGYDIIDIIKEELEDVCPGVVSCADILVLAAREAVLVAGGPFYPLHTGRRDSALAYWEVATYELPSPHGDLDETLASFASRGFNARETISLLGSHSIGKIHCKFFQNRLFNFGGTNNADPTLNVDFLNELRSKCSNNNSSKLPAQSPSSHLSPVVIAPSPSFNNSSSFLLEGPAIQSDTEGTELDFGIQYYRGLLQGKGVLYSDQQLMAGEETGIWVRAYASDASLFRRDFAQAMMKLSNTRILTAPSGQIRHNCAKVV